MQVNQFLEVNSLGQLGWSDWATFLDILDSMRVSLAQSPTLQSVYRWVRLAQSPTLQSVYRWGQPSTVTHPTVSIQVGSAQHSHLLYIPYSQYTGEEKL